MAPARATKPPAPELRFRGAPPGLEALAPAGVAPEDADPATVALKLGRVEQLAPLEVTEVGAGASYLRFSLPQTTPPGTYEGRARLGEDELPVAVEVEAWESLRFVPTAIRLQVASGGEVEAHVTALNDGNAALEIAGAYAFGLFTDDGVELAFATAFREPEAKGEGRFDRFVEGVAEQHGGFVRVKVSEGSGTLDPGELRTLGLAFRYPDGLEAGRTYGGALTIHGLSLHVRTTVTAADTPAPRVRAAAAATRPTRRRKAG